MTPADLKSFRLRLGLSQAEFARAVGAKSDRTVRGWEFGERGGEPTDIPGPVIVICEMADDIPVVAKWLKRRAEIT